MNVIEILQISALTLLLLAGFFGIYKYTKQNKEFKNL